MQAVVNVQLAITHVAVVSRSHASSSSRTWTALQAWLVVAAFLEALFYLVRAYFLCYHTTRQGRPKTRSLMTLEFAMRWIYCVNFLTSIHVHEGGEEALMITWYAVGVSVCLMMYYVLLCYLISWCWNLIENVATTTAREVVDVVV